VGKTKQKTEEQIRRGKDNRLRKTYGISMSEYEQMLSRKELGCWICGEPAKTVSLSVDHDHAYKKVKIESEKIEQHWTSHATYNGKMFWTSGNKKSESIAKIRSLLQRASVRGPLCVWCNRGLRYYHDRPDLLRAAAEYLEKFKQGSPLTGREEPR
jgi:hypothetical protein